MDILFTFDYEYFIGPKTGTFNNTLLRPVSLLLEILNTYNVKVTFFVDVGYIKRCQELDADNENCEHYIAHLKELCALGHDLQLHIHPHWEDSVYENGEWQVNISRYRLHDYSIEEAASIIENYANLLNTTFAIHAKAFRAGGWCLQPFSHISLALSEAGITLDSTVFYGGKNNNSVNFFDFTNMPILPYWRFAEDPLIPRNNGYFTELPIASLKVSPLFYWRLAISQLIGGEIHKTYGDGVHTKVAKTSLLKLLMLPSSTVVSTDGYKASLLQKSLANMKHTYGDASPMVTIGHPKSVTPFSLNCIERFVEESAISNRYVTVSDWLQDKENVKSSRD